MLLTTAAAAAPAAEQAPIIPGPIAVPVLAAVPIPTAVTIPAAVPIPAAVTIPVAVPVPAAVTLPATVPVPANLPVPATLLVTQAWSRPTPPVAASGVVYLSIANHGTKADHLVALATPAARSAQIHESRTVNGMVEMRELAQVDCPPGATVKMEPGGLHIMLVGLTQPLQTGAHFPLALRFEDAGEMTVSVYVGAPQ
jgi:periplasmic copper chaperone A